MNILHPTYMRQLIDAQNNGLIKIVSGIRRAGKSYLLKTLFRAHLLEQGVPADHMLVIDLEGRQNKPFRNPDYLLDWVEQKYTICLENAGRGKDATGAAFAVPCQRRVP